MGELPDHQKFEIWKQDQASIGNQGGGLFDFLIVGAFKLVVLGIIRIIWPVFKGLLWNLPKKLLGK